MSNVRRPTVEEEDCPRRIIDVVGGFVDMRAVSNSGAVTLPRSAPGQLVMIFNSGDDPLVVQEGSGRRWTLEANRVALFACIGGEGWYRVP